MDVKSLELFVGEAAQPDFALLIGSPAVTSEAGVTSAASWALYERCLHDGRLVPPRSAPALSEEVEGALGPAEALRLANARAFDALTAAAFADGTLAAYGGHVAAWGVWCRERGVDPLPLDVSEVVAFLMAYAFETDGSGDFLQSDGKLVPARASSSVHTRLSALNKLAVFAGVPEPGALPAVDVVMRGMRRILGVRPRHQRDAIDMALLRRFLEGVEGDTAMALRNRTIALLRARLRLSAAEIAGLDWSQIALESGEAEIDLGESRVLSVRCGVIQQVCLACALHQLRAVAVATDRGFGPVFPGPSRGSRLRRTAVFAAVASLIRRSQLPLTWEGLPGCDDEELGRLVATSPPGTRLARARTRAILTLGWHTAMRRSELVGLNWGDLAPTSTGVWRVLIRFSKTDQEGRGQEVRIAPSPDPTSIPCPVLALTEWREALSDALGRPLRADEPVFPPLTGRGGPKMDPVSGSLLRLDGEAINGLIKRLAVDIGLVARGGNCSFGGHSLRSGFITEALRDDKLSIAMVQEQSRHREVGTLLRYRREVNLDGRNASSALQATLAARFAAESRTKST